MAEIFYERFFPSRKTRSNVCTVAWFWQQASGQFLSRSKETREFQLWFPALIK